MTNNYFKTPDYRKAEHVFPFNDRDKLATEQAYRAAVALATGPYGGHHTRREVRVCAYREVHGYTTSLVGRCG